MGEILIPRRTKVEKGYELLADITVSTATTSVDITGLNIGKGDEVVLVADMTNPTGTATAIRLLPNSTTETGYYNQLLTANGASVSADRTTSNAIASVDGGTKSFSEVPIKLTNSGYFIYQASILRMYGGSGILLHNYYVTSTATFTSITTLYLRSSVTNGIGIGSRFQLYKIGGA